MKRDLLPAYTLGLLMMAGSAFGAPCDGVGACSAPGNTGLTAPTVTAASIRGLQVRNSGTTANAQFTGYWFFAYATSLPAPTLTTGSADFVDPGDGLRIRAGFVIPDNNSPTAANDLMVNGRINSTQAGRTYNIYSQACRSGAPFNDSSSTNCSGWVLIYSNITTQALPTNVFFTPVPADVTTSAINVRVDGAKVDTADPLDAEIIVRNVDTGNTDTTLFPVTFGLAMPISGASIPSYPFVPNTQYRYLGRLQYPFQFTLQENKGPFFTTPVTPGAVSASPTHFTVTLNWTNAGGLVGNPQNTSYHVTLTGPGAPGVQTVLSTTGGPGLSGNPAEPMTKKITGLQAGTPYTATVQAMNQNGAWNPSGIVTVNFTTLPINPTFSVTGVTTSQATFNVTLNPPTGITDFIVERCVGGVGGICVQDVKTAWPGGASITDTMGTLTPNTAYQFYIQFFEGVDFSAFSPQPDQGQAINQFTTTPVAPTAGTVTGSGANSITANFTDPSLNPTGSTYELQVCLNAGFTLGCQSVTGGKVAGVNQSLVINTLTPSTLYFAQVRTRNVTRPTWPDSSWTSLGSATTQALITQPASITPNPVNTLSGTGTLGVQVNSNNAAPGMTYNWVIVPPPSTVAPTMCANNNTATGNSCLVTFHQIGTGYSATVTITDALSRTVTSNVIFNVVPVPQSVSITPLSLTVNQGAAAVQFTANAIDQFNNAISPVTGVIWTTPGGNGGNGFTAAGATVSFNPTGATGTFNIHASVTMNGVTQSDPTDATITVQPSAGSVTITGPVGGRLNQLNTFTYTAVVRDLSNVIIPTPVTWSVVPPVQLVAGDPANTIDPVTGLFTANNPGNYTVSAAATVNGSNASGTSPIRINAVAGSIAIAPSPKTVITGDPAVTFTATVNDPFGVLISNTPVTWGGSITGGGSLSTAGPSVSTDFTGTTPGVFTLTASSTTANGNTVTANDTVTVSAAGPHVDSLSFVMSTGNKGGTLTVVGHDNVANKVTSTWASDPSVTFTPVSGTSADGVQGIFAVNFTKAGTFTLTDSLGSGVSSSTIVNVPADLSGIKVCPAGSAECPNSITVKTLEAQQFTASGTDQFGNPMPVVVDWLPVGGGASVNSAGVFSAQTLGNSFTVTAKERSTGKTGSILVTAVSFNVSGAHAFPVPYKASMANGGVIHFVGLGSNATLHIYTGSGRRVFDTRVISTTGTFDWNIKNSSGENVASGVYSYVIESSEGKKNGKLIIIQ